LNLQLNNPDLLLSGGWINGREIQSDQKFPVSNPATRETIVEVSDLGAADAQNAIAAASAAFKQWKKRPMQERVKLVERWADLIAENADDLGTIICSENGKPYREARGEAMQCAALLRWFADSVQRQQGQDYPSGNESQRNYTIKQPVGVVACITPWNFPAAAVAVKSGAAIVTGCTTITKPSDETPLIALAFARLSGDAGLPAGVFNVIPCSNPAAVGDELCSSPDVRMLSFTGSTSTGRHLYSACGDTIKRLALELGGNAPFVVFADADMEKAVSAAVGARFYNSGQICVGANRFLLQQDIYDEFAEKLAERVGQMTVGNGFDDASDIGPMINQAAIDRLTHLVDSATAMGARVLTGGRPADNGSLFFSPTVIANMSVDMPAYQAEIFGPLACLYKFSDEEEAMRLANDTEAGLSAYVFTSDQGRLLRCCDALEAGVVGANSANIFSNDLPFGGMKQSGIGKEHGMQCLDEFVETKSICLGL
jgi:succinate-semialdehyde dehydrogenase/glutarate-semialdehyde dehydrogenase